MEDVSIIDSLIAFLDDSPTAWHAVKSIEDFLKKASFRELCEREPWQIAPSSCYFVKRNGSTLCAFITPKKRPKRVRLLASHTDSPGLKLKPQPDIKKGHALLFGVEVYGAPLLSSWLNRDLGIAGRVIFSNDGGQLHEGLVRLEAHPVVIPQLAIHLDREVNEKGLLLNKQEHLNPLVAVGSCFGVEEELSLKTLLKEQLPLEEVIAHDLFLYPLEKARRCAFKGSFLSSYRIDSLASVHASLMALLTSGDPLEEEIKMVLFWDSEETGSQTAQGASSPFFMHLLERVMSAWSASKEDFYCLVNRSVCLSIDLAHALHPNYPEKHDLGHSPQLSKGVVIKSNAQNRYATSACSCALIQWVARQLNIPTQLFVSRNDTPCGTTIGPLHACQSGMATVDIGVPQLSMHSARELMACQDHLDMYKLLKGLFELEYWPEVCSYQPKF